MGMDKLLTVRMTDKDRERWGEAARAAGLSLSRWVRAVLDAAVSPVVVDSLSQPEPDRAVLDRAKVQIDALPVPVRSKGKPPLCERCSRIKAPSCRDCLKAWGLA